MHKFISKGQQRCIQRTGANTNGNPWRYTTGTFRLTATSMLKLAAVGRGSLRSLLAANRPCEMCVTFANKKLNNKKTRIRRSNAGDVNGQSMRRLRIYKTLAVTLAHVTLAAESPQVKSTATRKKFEEREIFDIVRCNYLPVLYSVHPQCRSLFSRANTTVLCVEINRTEVFNAMI